jgi:hypothetical protein
MDVVGARTEVRMRRKGKRSINLKICMTLLDALDDLRPLGVELRRVTLVRLFLALHSFGRQHVSQDPIEADEPPLVVAGVSSSTTITIFYLIRRRR